MLALNVKIGQYVEIEDRRTGLLGAIRIEDRRQNEIRLVFDMPGNVLVRLFNHRSPSFGLGKRTHGTQVPA